MSKLAFRTLSQEGGPGFSEDQVKALAATYKVKDGPNDNGDYFERPGRPADFWPSPFPKLPQAMMNSPRNAAGLTANWHSCISPTCVGSSITDA